MFNVNIFCFVIMMVCLNTITVYAIMKGPMQAELTECIKEYDTTEEKVMDAQKTGNLDGIDPCLFACVFKKTEIIDSTGMYDLEKALAFNRDHMKNIDFLNKMDNIKKDCAKVNEEEVKDGDKGCERAVLLFKCHFEHQRKLGFHHD